MKILLVEDEVELSNSIKEYFVFNNFEVDTAYDGEQAVYFAKEYSYDVIIMDVMMPKMDGLTALKHIRSSENSTPIILLTAKSELEDKIEGLELGADDYLTKPFHIKELLARVRALSRRRAVLVNTLSFGNITIDAVDYLIKNEDKFEHLTPKEFQLLEYLIKNQDRYNKSEKIFEDIWSSDTESDITVVFVFASVLRRKIKNINGNAKIVSLRGEGYRIVKD